MRSGDKGGAGSVEPARPRAGVPAASVSAVAAGDREAFALLYDQTSAQVYGLIMHIVADPARAEVLMCRTYRQIWATAHRFDTHTDTPASWVLSIAHRAAVADCRVRREQTAAPIRRPGGRGRRHVRTRRGGQLRAPQLLQSLPADERAAVTMAYFEGYRRTQIAQVLGAPVAVVRARLGDGLRRVRDLGVSA